MNTSSDLAAQIDALIAPSYPPDKPGAAVIVVREGQVIFRQGYGLANLELGVAVEPHMVFRLGSITKQFTAVCILMLYEQGKLDLQDDLTRFLPDFPTGGRRVTVEHLLTHTSGIKSYTDMPEWLPLWRNDLSLEELIAIFKDQPFDFEPGDSFRYNNSGYILLGAIIEKVSGMKYADFVQEHLFKPLGMSHSLYDDPVRLIPGRVAGYQRDKDGFANAAYLSMTQPYAAGSLASSVDDLALWDAALYTDRLVRPETLALAFRSYALNNGDATQYGYGWATYEYQGTAFIEHGGGINGFLTDALRVPDEKVYVAILTNCEAPETMPDTLAFKIAGLVIGKPVVEPTPIELEEAQLDSFLGVYKINENEERCITRSGSKLYSQRSGGPRFELLASAEDTFFIKDSVDFIIFERDDRGKVKGMRVQRRMGPPERCPLTDKPLPAERAAAELPAQVLQRFTGRFELAPGFIIEIELEEGQLFARAPGQEKLPLFPESPERLFARDMDITVSYEFDAQGQITACTFKQGPQVMPLKKLG